MAAAADGDLERVNAGKVERGRDVGRAGAPCDHRGPAVDHRVPAAARGVVVRVAGLEDGSRE